MAHVANITIQSSKVPGDLTDYVVYVDLSDLGTPFWDTVSSGGGDIRVYKDGGVTELAREVVFCDTATDTGELYFKYTGTLSSSSNTVVEIHVDGISSDYAVTATYGRNNVWSDYVAVYHMQEDPATTNVIDSTGNGNDLVDRTSVVSTTGKLSGNGVSFTTSTSSISTNTSTTGIPTGASSDTLTVTLWFNCQAYSTRQEIFWFNKSNSSSTGAGNWVVRLEDAAGGGSGGYTWFRTYGGNDGGSTSQVVSTNTWYHYYVDWTAGTGSNTYINNSLAKAATFTDTSSSTSTEFGLGKSSVNDGTGLDGYADEVRVSDSILGNDWRETEYNNQSDTSTFYAVTDITGSSLATTKPMQPIWFF